MARKNARRSQPSRKHEWDNDPWTISAKQLGYRSRSAFKLLAIEEKYRIFQKKQLVLDLGAAPGGWSQIMRRKLPQSASLLCVDLSPIAQFDTPGCATDIWTRDIYEDKFVDDLKVWLENKSVRPHNKFGLIVSDMAPYLTGIKEADASASTDLIERAMYIAGQLLGENGVFVVKMFQNREFENLVQQARTLFKSVKLKSVDSTRKSSTETYLIANK